MHIYIGTFLIAFTTLALEVTLTRLLSVVTWYHLAFFAISTAMLGMTAGAVTVYLRPAWFAAERVSRSVALPCLGYAVATPISLILLCLTPLLLIRSIMGFLSILIVTIVCLLPFYFSGIAISAALTKFGRNIGKLYASDLMGAALGCLVVLVGLEALGAPSLILLSAAVGALAALVFQWGTADGMPRLRRVCTTTLVVLLALAALNASTLYGITPIIIKEQVVDPSTYLLEKWNSFSRVAVFPQRQTPPQYWGPSPRAPQDPLAQYYMDIDGAAGTTVRRFTSSSDIDHLRFDVTNMVYYLRPHGGAAIIGVGGGRDIQAALLFGHEKVTGIDVNPIFINLLRNEFKEFAGVGNRDNVRLIVDEARSYMSRAPERYSVIQMSLIDTWAATGAGASSLSENALYTMEAWKVFYGRLADDGIFTVSRWYNPVSLGETGRIVSFAVASLPSPA
jgi:SAM-dependent methyltransferase